MLRILCLFILIAAPLPVLAQDGADPVVRMGSMRTVLERAKSIKITFASEVQSDKGKDTIQGTMIVGEGNKGRAEMAMSVVGKTVELVMISDGKTMQTVAAGSKPRSKPSETNLRKNMLAMIERAGMAVPLFTIRTKKDDKQEQDLSKQLTISDLKFKETEKNVYKCTYRLNVEDKVLFRVELWTDLKTNLPLRRVLETEKGANQVTVIETYTVELEPMLKADTFELLKE